MSAYLKRLPYFLLLGMVLFYASNPYSLLDFPLDDAWIHRVYSQSFAYGHGFAYNPGQQEAGSTSPLWSMVTAPVHWMDGLGTDAVVLTVKTIGTLLALFCVGAVMQCTRKLTQSELAAIVAGALVALDPRLVFSALSGMETNLLLALWLGSALLLVHGRVIAATVLVSLAPTARPEALVILPLYAFAMLIMVLRKTLRARQCAWLALLPVPMLLWAWFCKSANGHWLPTTFYMKSTAPEIGAGQWAAAWNLLGLNGPLPSWMVLVLLLYALYALLRTYRNATATLLMVAAPLCFLFGVLFSREFLPAGYYWLRWTDPATLLLTATAAMGLGLALGRASSWKTRSLIALALLASLPHFGMAASSWRARLISDSRAIELITVQAGKWLNANTSEDTVIAVNDAGATRYFSQRKTIDLMGLNCADIAFGHRKAENSGIVDYLAITPTWFVGKGLYEGLPVCTHFAIPPEEYTITPNKGQSEIVIFDCR